MKKLARVLSLALVAGVIAVVPGTPAHAVTGNLNVDPETPSGETTDPAEKITFTATVVTSVAPIVPVKDANVHFRIESGPGATPPDHGTPLSQGEFGCTTNAAGTCPVEITGETAGTGGKSLIRWWIEDDGIPGPNALPANEADTTEGQNETTTAGTKVEPDNTDVVEITWAPAPVGIDLDVDPEEQAATTTPATTGRAAALGDATFTATVLEDGAPAEGKKVNFEVTAGPNDGMTFDCTTVAAGTCEASYTGGATEGVDTVRGVVDGETADAGEGADETTDAGDTEEADGTDVVEVTWSAEPPPPPPEDCTGTAGDDILIGTEEDDVCNGGAGDDTIRTLGGDDTARGGGGDDLLALGAGNDSGNGGPGADVVRGGAGNDNLNGGGGKRDKAVGGSGKDKCKAEVEKSCE